MAACAGTVPIHPHVVLYFDGSEQCDASTQIVRKAFRIVAGGVPRDITVTVQTPEGVPGPALTSVAGSAGGMSSWWEMTPG